MDKFQVIISRGRIGIPPLSFHLSKYIGSQDWVLVYPGFAGFTIHMFNSIDKL